jgi:hypothetical protein
MSIRSITRNASALTAVSVCVRSTAALSEAAVYIGHLCRKNRVMTPPIRAT